MKTLLNIKKTNIFPTLKRKIFSNLNIFLFSSNNVYQRTLDLEKDIKINNALKHTNFVN